MSGLSEYLEQKRAAWLKLQARPIDNLAPVILSAKATAEERSGVRRIQIRDFQIAMDGGANLAGHDLGPSSPELQLGVLGSCLTHIFLIQAAELQVVLDSLDVTVTGTMNPRAGLPGHEAEPCYPQNMRYAVELTSPATEERIAELHRRVEAVCPIHHLISRPQTITGYVNRTVSPAGGEDDPALPGLRDYLREKAGALAVHREKRIRDGGAPHTLTATVSARGRSGVRRIRIREFQLLSDSPPDFAGYNLSPASPELQLGVLASCLTHVFLIQAAEHRVPLDALETGVTAKIDPRAGRPGFEDAPRHPTDIAYVVDLTSPAGPEAIEQLHRAVKAVCPIFNLLSREQHIEGAIVSRPIAVAA
jgi:uncharacterized OsmC-like protein